MTTQNEKMEEVLSRPTITPDELHRLGVLPLSRNGIYEACRNGELDHMRFGKKISPSRTRRCAEDSAWGARDKCPDQMRRGPRPLRPCATLAKLISVEQRSSN
jgi:hypothetical protein